MISSHGDFLTSPFLQTYACCVRKLEKLWTIYFFIVNSVGFGNILYNLIWCVPSSVSLSRGGLKDKANMLWSHVSKAILWLLWNETNARKFSDECNFFIYFCDHVQLKASHWNSLHKLFYNYTTHTITLEGTPCSFAL